MTEDTLKTESSLSDVFYLFCHNYDPTQPVMKTPFEINGYIYATDGHALIRCKKSDCDFEIENAHTPPNCEAVIPTPNTNTVLNIDKSVFEQYKTADEYESIGEDRECSICKGRGEVTWKFDCYTKEYDCPVCSGSGLEAESRSVETGRKTIGNFRVKLNETYLRMDLFYRLVRAQDVLGGDITLLFQSTPTSAVLFKVGFCEILVMPCPLGEYEEVEGVLNVE
jgi:hypothetical protein